MPRIRSGVSTSSRPVLPSTEQGISALHTTYFTTLNGSARTHRYRCFTCPSRVRTALAQFSTGARMKEAQFLSQEWLNEYNLVRPHGTEVGDLTPPPADPARPLPWRHGHLLPEAGQSGRVAPPQATGGPFSRASKLWTAAWPGSRTKAPGRGTGLGLSVSAQIAADHGGRILAESQPGDGATTPTRGIDRLSGFRPAGVGALPPTDRRRRRADRPEGTPQSSSQEDFTLSTLRTRGTMTSSKSSMNRKRITPLRNRRVWFAPYPCM